MNNYIIICNGRIYFESPDIAEIRELPEDDDNYYYKKELELIEAKANDGGYHSLNALSQQVNNLLISYEGDRDSEFLSLEDDELTQPDYSPLTENEERVLNRIGNIDNILKQVLEEAERNDDIPTLHELVNIYELMEAGAVTLEQAEEYVRKHLVNSRAYANKAEVNDMR